jgi:cellulose synthase operon protein C
VPALALRTEIDIASGELTAAEQRIRRIQALQPKSGLGSTLSGELALARKQPDIALAAFRRAHEADKSTASFMRVFSVTMRRDKVAGIRLAEQWVQANPRDGLVWRALGDSHFLAGNMAGARSAYETLGRIGVRDPDALNNLAHVMLALKDTAAAQKAADQAVALAPTAPHILGTTGWIAHHAGQNDRALQLLRDARLRDPASADTRYFLASVLSAVGRAAEARVELTAALAPDSGISYRAEAEKLLGSLR